MQYIQLREFILLSSEQPFETKLRMVSQIIENSS